MDQDHCGRQTQTLGYDTQPRASRVPALTGSLRCIAENDNENFSVVMLGNYEDRHGARYYVVRVNAPNGCTSEQWEKSWRYSEILEAHDIVCLLLQSSNVDTRALPAFPPKKAVWMLGSRAERFIEERQKALGQYLNQMLDIVHHCFPQWWMDQRDEGVNLKFYLHTLAVFLGAREQSRAGVNRGRLQAGDRTSSESPAPSRFRQAGTPHRARSESLESHNAPAVVRRGRLSTGRRVPDRDQSRSMTPRAQHVPTANSANISTEPCTRARRWSGAKRRQGAGSGAQRPGSQSPAPETSTLAVPAEPCTAQELSSSPWEGRQYEPDGHGRWVPRRSALGLQTPGQLENVCTTTARTQDLDDTQESSQSLKPAGRLTLEDRLSALENIAMSPSLEYISPATERHGSGPSSQVQCATEDARQKAADGLTEAEHPADTTPEFGQELSHTPVTSFCTSEAAGGDELLLTPSKSDAADGINDTTPARRASLITHAGGSPDVSYPTTSPPPRHGGCWEFPLTKAQLHERCHTASKFEIDMAANENRNLTEETRVLRATIAEAHSENARSPLPSRLSDPSPSRSEAM